MKRRNFIANSFLLTSGILTGCTKDVMLTAWDVRDRNPGGKLAQGKVLSSGVGLAKVVVSDGFSVVETTDDGSYEIVLTNYSQHVFVSVPSGYAFPNERNLVIHFSTIPFGDVKKINFNLEPLEMDDKKHQFLVWADPQIMEDANVAQLMTQTVPDVAQYRESIGKEELIHGICVGDLVGDSLELFLNYNNAVDNCGIPFFQVLGNHDVDFSSGSSDNFKELYGPTYYSYNRGKVHYVVLNDIKFSSNGAYKAHIFQEQLDWLKKDLSFVPLDKLIVLSVHIPVMRENSIANKAQLLEILKEYKVHILSGHVHYSENIVKGNIFEHLHGAVCGAWWTGPVCADGTPSGYAIYYVDGNKLKWKYKSVGFEKEYQFRTSIIANSNGTRKIIANVWNCDPAWKIEWFADNSFKGLMKPITGYDNFTVDYYKNIQLPDNLKWVAPIQTNHLFSAVVPSSAKKVTIMVTDRFGEKYQSIVYV